MRQDENGLHLSREDLLNDLELLETFYDLIGKQEVIAWILRKESKIQEDKCCEHTTDALTYMKEILRDSD